MENNTLISHELEEMRAQLGMLKEKLEKQTIINETHIRNSMKSKMSDINKTVTGTIIAGVFALCYSTWFFYWQDFSLAFVISTFVMLAVCLGITIAQRVILGKMDFSQGNLVETAEKLSKIKKHYQDWYKIAVPMLIVWFGWMMYEILSIHGLESPMAIGFCCGAFIGGVIGGIFGMRINRKVARKATEILDQIAELQQ
jgi:uncharacterized membrane protein YbjE (DUF340 family)